MDDNEKQIVTKKNPGVFITVLNDNDVLQGRGSGSMQNTGNIRFRTMVEELRPAYVATSSRKEKAKMITSMVKLIQSRQGRFLQPVNESELEELSLSSNTEYFVEMSDKEAAEKAKQAIRYVHYKKVPLEDKRRKKRLATTDASSLRGKNDQLIRLKNKIANVNGVGYISNNTSMMAAMFPNRVVDGRNFQSQQITAMPTDLNINSMAHFGQQAHVGQMLASLQDVKPIIESAQSQQQASLLGALQPNTLQQLTSTLLSTNNLSQPSPTLSIAQQNDTHNLQQQQPHPHQFNALFQSLIQQQQHQHQHHQHQQQQQQLLEALQQQQQNQKNHQQQQQQLLEALQHQQKQLQISSTIQSMHQTQKSSSETNPMLAMLSNTNQSLQTNPALSLHQTFPASSMNQQSEAGTMMLSNQSPSMLHGQQSNSIAPGISAFLSPTPLSSQPGAIVIGNNKVVQSIDGGQPNGNNNLETVQGFGSTHFPFNTAMDNINSNTNSVKSIESTKRAKLLSDNISQEAQV